MKTTRTAAVLFAALALQAAALAQSAAPAPKPTAPATTEANASTAGPTKATSLAGQPVTPSQPAQGQVPGQSPGQSSGQAPNQPQANPGAPASGVQGTAPGARPPSGKPPVVVGPNGQSHAAAAPRSSSKVAMPGSRSAGSINKPASRTIRVGVANTGSASTESNSNNTNAVASIPITSRIASIGGVQSSDGQSVHTWTRDGSTFSADAAPSGAGTATGSLGNAISAGILAGSSVTNTNVASKGAIPAGIVNDMLIRIGGMGSQMSGRTSSAAE